MKIHQAAHSQWEQEVSEGAPCFLPLKWAVSYGMRVRDPAGGGKHLWSALVLAFVAPVLVAQDYGVEKPRETPVVSIPLTPEQKAALQAVDVRLAGVAALMAQIDDPAYKAKIAAAVKDLEKRRAALAKNFDAGLYEALMHAVISRYQTVALWLTPPRVPGPGPKSATVPKPAAPADKKTTKATGQ